MKLRIGLDLDDTLNEFMNPYLKRFGYPKSDGEITKNVQQVLIKDREWWVNLPVKNKINFIPELYCTQRVCNKDYSKSWLKNNGYRSKPVYQVLCQRANKARYIKGKVDIFIDDSVSNFIQMNLAGLPCLLIASESNEKWGSYGKIYSLDKEEIEYGYECIKESEDFNNYLREIKSNFY
mgnify:FL=1